MAIAAFALSIYNTIQAESPPTVSMTMPAVVRLEHFKEPGRTQIQIQTAFTVDKSSTRTAIVQQVTLALTPPPGYANREAKAPLLYYGEPDSIQEVAYGQDVAPIVVSQDSPASPVLVFELEDDPFAGRWDFTITATLVDGQKLSENSCFALSPESVSFLMSGAGSPTRPLFKDFVASIDGVEITTAGLDATCYRG